MKDVSLISSPGYHLVLLGGGDLGCPEEQLFLELPCH